MKCVVKKNSCTFLIILTLLTAGCSISPDRYHHAYASHRATIERVLILPPEISLFADTPEGKPSRLDAQSQEISNQTLQLLEQSLASQSFVVKRVDASLLQTKESISLRALYRNVNRAIQLHLYGGQVFPGKTRPFDYALGSISGLLDVSGADALVLATGMRTVTKQGARTWVSIAVVEPTGQIIWYGMRNKSTTDSMQTCREVLDLAEQVMQPFMRDPS